MYQYSKNFLSVIQLTQKLTDAGMTIDSQAEANTALTTSGYYHLKGYSFHWIDPAAKKYIAGTNFSDVLTLYHFDSELSHLAFSYLSQIEVTLRSRLVNAFQSTSLKNSIDLFQYALKKFCLDNSLSFHDKNILRNHVAYNLIYPIYIVPLVPPYIR